MSLSFISRTFWRIWLCPDYHRRREETSSTCQSFTESVSILLLSLDYFLRNRLSITTFSMNKSCIKTHKISISANTLSTKCSNAIEVASARGMRLIAVDIFLYPTSSLQTSRLHPKHLPIIQLWINIPTNCKLHKQHNHCHFQMPPVLPSFAIHFPIPSIYSTQLPAPPLHVQLDQIPYFSSTNVFTSPKTRAPFKRTLIRTSFKTHYFCTWLAQSNNPCLFICRHWGQ